MSKKKVGKKIFRGVTNYYGHIRIKNEWWAKKRSSKKFCLYIQNGGDNIQKWVNLSSFWKILALAQNHTNILNLIQSHSHRAMQTFRFNLTEAHKLSDSITMSRDHTNIMIQSHKTTQFTNILIQSHKTTQFTNILIQSHSHIHKTTNILFQIQSHRTTQTFWFNLTGLHKYSDSISQPTGLWKHCDCECDSISQDHTKNNILIQSHTNRTTGTF